MIELDERVKKMISHRIPKTPDLKRILEPEDGAKFKIGDKFKMNIELMGKNNLSIDRRDPDKIWKVLGVEHYAELREIISYEHMGSGVYAQINAVWCEKIERIKNSKFVFNSKEEQDKLRIDSLYTTHECVNAKRMILPKYVLISPDYEADFAPDGYKRTGNDTATLIFCPFCNERLTNEEKTK